MTTNEMKNTMIEEFGFEDWRTIEFFRVCENGTQEEIDEAFTYAMNWAEDEEE